MHNSKIYTILSEFDKVEQNRLRKFLISPYFNRSQLLVRLFELLVKYINGNRVKTLEKESIWKKLYQNTEFDDIRFRKLCSDLLKLVEEYLAQESYNKNSVKKSICLLEAINEKKIYKLYKNAEKNAIKEIERLPHKTDEYYSYHYQIEINKYRSLQLALDRSSKSNIENILFNLDNFYILEKLKYYNSTLSRKNFNKFEFNSILIDELITTLSNEKNVIPQIQVYLQALLVQKDEKEENYKSLKSLLDNHADKFPNQEANELYTYALNYCLRRVNRGETEMLKEFLDLNEDLLQKGILGKGNLSPWKFQNIVTAACRIGRYEWTRKFIDKYQDQLPEEYKENAVTYNLARLYFYQKKYPEVVSLLQFVEYEDIGYNLGSKALLLRTYYEIDEQESLYSLIDSFRIYLNRHKEDIKPQRRTNFLNLLKFVRKLTRIIPGDKKAVDKLKAELASTKAIAAEKSWLEEKIVELA